jgi:hypothetical protein
VDKAIAPFRMAHWMHVWAAAYVESSSGSCISWGFPWYCSLHLIGLFFFFFWEQVKPQGLVAVYRLVCIFEQQQYGHFQRNRNDASMALLAFKKVRQKTDFEASTAFGLASVGVNEDQSKWL